MDVTKIVPSLESIAGSKVLILLSIKENYLYENKKKTDTQDGWKAELVCCDNGYEKLSCKILTKPSITQEMIDNAEAPIRCTLDGLDAQIYRVFETNEHKLRCIAKTLILVK